MLDINLQLIIAQIITFLIGAWLLWKIAFKQLVAVFKERANKINNDLDQADRTRKEVEQLKADLQSQLSAIAEKSQEVIRKATIESQKVRDEIIREARTQSQDILKRAETQIAIEKAKAIKELRQEVARLSLEISEKIIVKTVDEATHTQLVEQAFAELEKKS
jgi:F-type H+-transporting ATPase subunit b